jgi:hypothetical protein
MELLAAAQGGAPSLAAANALHLTTTALKIIAEMAAPSTLFAVFEVGPNMPAVHQGERSSGPVDVWLAFRASTADAEATSRRLAHGLWGRTPE